MSPVLSYKKKTHLYNIFRHPNFHFLTAGRMLPMGMEQSTLEGIESRGFLTWSEPVAY